MPEPAWHLYVVRTRAGHLYTGIATDVERRIEEHEAGEGRGAKALRGRGPLELVYGIKVGDRGLALRLEHRLKQRSRAEKEAIVASAPSKRTLVRKLVPPDAAE
jgi:putative endonuclease